MEKKRWNEANMKDKVVLITGSNAGIGKQTALEISRLGARVILACRNLQKGTDAATEIINETNNSKISVKVLDLNNLASIKKFAEEVLKEESRLDVLINNAGVMSDKRTLTSDGLEVNFSSNYVGPFLLTRLLLPLLKKSAPSRIVMLSSMLYLWGYVDFDNLQAEKGYGKFTTYANSKVCLMLFMHELNQRLIGSKVTVNAVSPGQVKSNIHGNSDVSACFNFIIKHAFKDVKEGAETSVYAAACSDLDNVSGQLFASCRRRSVTSHVEDSFVAKKLWDFTSQLVGLSSND